VRISAGVLDEEMAVEIGDFGLRAPKEGAVVLVAGVRDSGGVGFGT
jgi:hypothetical protein